MSEASDDSGWVGNHQSNVIGVVLGGGVLAERRNLLWTEGVGGRIRRPYNPNPVENKKNPLADILKKNNYDEDKRLYHIYDDPL